MGLVSKDKFVCFDCEATGLDPEKDRIIEIAAATFTYDGIIESKENLINPGIYIPQHTIEIHHITDAMVQKKPSMDKKIVEYLNFIRSHIVVGHGILFDLMLLNAEAKRCGIGTDLMNQTYIDTLRLARLYGESPTNSLETLRKHFNILAHGAHRAMNDVIVNIEVFFQLSKNLKRLNKLSVGCKNRFSLN